jgi:hypothetical protein
MGDILTHAPPLPLILDYGVDPGHDITTEVEEGIIRALQHRHRVRSIRLVMSVQNLQKLFVSMDDEFPMLETVILESLVHSDPGLTLPNTFRAPQLRHLTLSGSAFQKGYPLLTSTAGIVVLKLISMFAYFPPNELIQWLSLMPHLEMLAIAFHTESLDLNPEFEQQPLLNSTRTHATLPDLRYFLFKGSSAYLEALLPRMATPLLEKFHIEFVNDPPHSVPCLLQFISAREDARFSRATLSFEDDKVRVVTKPREASWKRVFSMALFWYDLDWQVSSLADLLNVLSPVLAAVEHLNLNLEYQEHETHDEAEHTDWRRLLGLFSNVKNLHVSDGLIRELSRSLRVEDGESPMELLPELKELSFPESSNGEEEFTSFIDARRSAGNTVSIVEKNASLDDCCVDDWVCGE